MSNRRTCSNGMLLKNLCHIVKFIAVNFGVLLGLYYSSSLATAMLLWPTDSGVSVDIHVAWPHCMCIASRYCRNFFADGHK